MSTVLFRNLSFAVIMLLWVNSPSLIAETTAEAASTPLPNYTNEQVVAKMLETKKAGKTEEALEFLSKELDRRADNPNEFGGLYTWVWTEAQVDSGRLDEDWSARLFDQLFISSQKHHYYSKMDDVMGNLLGTLDTAGRHGRQTEILEWWAEGRKKDG